MLPEDRHLTDSTDEVLGKAEAFMRRRRPVGVPCPDDDLPVLTDIVSDEDVLACEEEAPAPAATPEPEPASPLSAVPPLAEAGEVSASGERMADTALAVAAETAEPEVPPAEEAVEKSSPQALPQPAAMPETDPARMERMIAERIAHALAGQRQTTMLLLEEWLNFDLPTIINQEFNGASERIVRRSLQEVHTLLQAGDGGHQ